MTEGKSLFENLVHFTHSRHRVNWSGSALSNFYAAIRKALIVVIVARALGLLFGASFALWWIFS